MSAQNAFERRADFDHDLALEHTIPSRVSRLQAWSLVLLGTSLTALADTATGQDLWFGPLYLVAIGLAAWSLGWREAVGVGLACFAMTLGANGLSLYPYGTIAALWNLGMRIAAVLTFIVLLDHARNSYAREWRLARTDPLTGALNRQAFFELAAAPTRSRGWRMLAYADLDGLKKLNDKCGHAAGDQCLQAYVKHVRRIIRKQDIFARIGGDEFLAYMKVSDEAAAKEVASRLHLEMNTIASRIYPSLRCSVGVLIIPPGSRTIDLELRVADELMYEAKQRGAGLTVATVRELRGIIYTLRHWEMGQRSESNPLLEPKYRKSAIDNLNAAA